jgi:hypothetical protein
MTAMVRSSVKAKEGQYGHDHDHQSYEIDQGVHVDLLAPEQGKQDDDGKRHPNKPKKKPTSKAHDLHSNVSSGAQRLAFVKVPSGHGTIVPVSSFPLERKLSGERER